MINQILRSRRLPQDDMQSVSSMQWHTKCRYTIQPSDDWPSGHTSAASPRGHSSRSSGLGSDRGVEPGRREGIVAARSNEWTPL